MTASIGNLTGASGSFTRVAANNFKGGAFTSNDDFFASNSSVNQNFALINGQQALLDNCMFVTKMCIPQNPSASLSCPNCISSAPLSSFSAIATASISQCRQGCNYNWISKGSGLVFSGCNPGTVPKGGSANPTCRVSASLTPQKSATGSIEIVVINSHYTSRSDSDSLAVSFKNNTVVNPFKNVVAGCFVDTIEFDQALLGSCIGAFAGTAAIVYSVGDFLGIENYQFTQPGDWSITWAGSCVGSGNFCIKTGVPSPKFSEKHTATAKLVHVPSGQEKMFSVTAEVFPLSNF